MNGKLTPDYETDIDALVAGFIKHCQFGSADFIEHLTPLQLAEAIEAINDALRNYPAGALAIITEVIDGLIKTGAKAHRDALESEELDCSALRWLPL